MAIRNNYTANVTFVNNVATTSIIYPYKDYPTDEPEHECVPVFRADLVFFAVVLFLAFVYNGLVLWAIVKSRKKLKQNFVYVYVGSLVIANIALVVNTLITIMSFLIPFERPIGEFHIHVYDRQNSVHRQIMNWWAFRKALTLGLFLISNASVVVLSWGIIQSANFVGRTAPSGVKTRIRKTSVTRNEGSRVTMTRRQKAYTTIFFVWFLPLVYTAVTYAWNGCINYCKCLPAYYFKQHFCSVETGENSNKCSNIWVPLANGYILLAVSIWFVLALVIFVLLFKAINKYKNVTRPIGAVSPTPTRVTKRTDRDINENQHNKSNHDLENGSAENMAEVTGMKQTNSSQPKNNSTMVKRRMHPTIKLLIALSVSYTLCTTPIMLCFVVDASVTDRNAVDDITVTVMSIVYLSYSVICPSLLIAYMPGLRKALIEFLMPCACTKTTVVNRMTRLATVRRK